MIVVLKPNPNSDKLAELKSWLESMKIQIHTNVGVNTIVLGLIGDTSGIDISILRSLDIVEDVKRISEPYKNANRKFHPEDTVVEVGGVKIGGGSFMICAGPCSIESEDQMKEVALAIKAAGARMLRGGAFKPRTSPYSFQGLGGKGIEILSHAKKASGLPVITEIMEISELEFFDDVDMIQVGARNMQNFQLLKELGRVNKPVLLKRGLANTIEEWLMSAEYIMAGGNEQIVLCERGIRTFETATRNTLDISAVPVLKKKTHLPVIIDPSHASGISSLVKPLAIAAAAIGADGLMIEVHNDPEHALSDGPQSLTPTQFADTAKAVFEMLPFAMKYSEAGR